MNKCCFCISLRTATLFLAVLGTITHLYGAIALTALADQFETSDGTTIFGLTLYSYLSGLACLAGAVGVIKHNAKHLRLFSAYYWTDLVLHTIFSVASAFMFFSMHTEICQQIVQEMPQDEPLDMETCQTAFIGSAWVVTVAMALNLLLKLHFALAIHHYMLQVKREEAEYYQRVPVPSEPVPAKKEEFIFVAGQEFVPDEKRKSEAQQ